MVRNGKPYPPASFAELEILPGVPETLARLRAAGYRIVVVTNQPDIARGATTMAAVDAIHDAMHSTLGLDDIRVCPHDDADRCAARAGRPKPGLLLREPAHDMAASVMYWRSTARHRGGPRCGMWCDNPRRLRLR